MEDIFSFSELLKSQFFNTTYSYYLTFILTLALITTIRIQSIIINRAHCASIRLCSFPRRLLAQYVAGIWHSSAQLFLALFWFILFTVIFCLFAVIKKILPDVPLFWCDVAIGSTFTVCKFTTGKYLIGLYIGNSAVAFSFGTADSVITLLIWVARIFFLGAEFTRKYALRF